MSQYGADMVHKEVIIENYIKNINFNDPKFNVKAMERDLTTLLHEKPAIKIDWKNEKAINEVSGKEFNVEKFASIKVIYTTEDNEGKLAPKSLTFYGSM